VAFFHRPSLYVFAGISFPYKGEALAAEIILIFDLAGLEAVRIFLGMYNKSFYRQLQLLYFISLA